MILIKHLIESMTELPLILGANTDETLVLSCSRNNINSSFLAIRSRSNGATQAIRQLPIASPVFG